MYEGFDWKGYLAYAGYPEDQIPESVTDEELAQIRDHWARTVYQEELAIAAQDPFLETKKEREEQARDRLLALAPEYRQSFGLKEAQPAEAAFSADEFREHVVNNPVQDAPLDYYLKTFAAKRIGKNTKYEYPYLEGLTKKDFEDLFMERNGIDPDLTTIEDIRNGNFGPAWMAQRAEEESNLPKGSAMRQGWLNFKKLTGLTTETFGDALGIEWMQNIGKGITENAIKTIEEEGYKSKYGESLVDTFKTQGPFAVAGKVLEMAQENWATTGVPLALAGMSALFGIAARNPRLAAQGLAGARASLAAATSADVAMGTGAAATVGRVGASTIAKSLAFASALGSGLEVGAVREELEEKSKEEGRQLYDPNDPGDVVAWGLLSAALDHVGNMMTFVGGGGLVRAAKGLVQSQQTRMLQAAEAAIRQAGKEAGKSWGRKIVEAMGTEGITEALQELPGIMAAKNKGVEYDAKEIRDRMIDAGVVGAVMGGGMRGVQALTERKPRTQSESDTTTPQQQTQTPPTNVPPAPNQPPPPGFNVASNTNYAEIEGGWAAWDGYNTGYGASKEEASQAIIDQSNKNKDTIDPANVTSTANESRVSFGNGGEIVVTGNGHRKIIGDIISLHNANDNVVNLDGTKTHNFDATTLSGLSADALRNRIEHSGKTAIPDTRSVRKARADQVDIAINYDGEKRDSNGNVIGRRAELVLDDATRNQLAAKGYRILGSQFDNDVQKVQLYRDGQIYHIRLETNGSEVTSKVRTKKIIGHFTNLDAQVERELSEQKHRVIDVGGALKEVQNFLSISSAVRTGGTQIERTIGGLDAKFVNRKALENLIKKKGGKVIKNTDRSITYELSGETLRLDLQTNGDVVVSRDGRFLGAYQFDGSDLGNGMERATYDLANDVTSVTRFSAQDVYEGLGYRRASNRRQNVLFIKDNENGDYYVIKVSNNGDVRTVMVPYDPHGFFARLEALESMRTIEDVRQVYQDQFRSGYVELVDFGGGNLGMRSRTTGLMTDDINDVKFFTSDEVDDIINNSRNSQNPVTLSNFVKIVGISQYVNSATPVARIVDWVVVDNVLGVQAFIERAKGYGAIIADYDSVNNNISVKGKAWNAPGSFNADAAGLGLTDLYGENYLNFDPDPYIDYLLNEGTSEAIEKIKKDIDEVRKATRKIFKDMDDLLGRTNSPFYSQYITKADIDIIESALNSTNKIPNSPDRIGIKAKRMRRNFYRARLLQAKLHIDTLLVNYFPNRIDIDSEVNKLQAYDPNWSNDEVRFAAAEAEEIALRLEEEFLNLREMQVSTSISRQIWNAIYPGNSGVEYGSFIERIHNQGNDFRFSRDVNAPRAERHMSLIDELSRHPFIGRGALSDLIDNRKLIILETQQEIENALLREGQAVPKFDQLGNIQGFASNDNMRVYLSSWGIKQGDAFRVLLHEMGAHTRRFGFSEAEFQEILAGIKANSTAQTPEGDHIRHAMWRAQNAKVSPNDPHYWEEVAAYLVEGSNEYAGLGMLDTMQAWVKRWLFTNGYIDATNFHYQDFTIFSLGMLRDSRIPLRLLNGKFDYSRHQNRIYDTRKFVESYVTEDIAKQLGYSREEVIEMVAAHLAGTYKAGNHVIGDLPDEDELMSHFPTVDADWRAFDRDDTVEDSQTLRFSRDARLEEMAFDSEIYGAEEAEVIAQYNDIYEKEQQPKGSDLDEREWAVSQTRSFKDWIDARKNAVEWVRNQRIDTGIPVASEIAPNKELPEGLKQFGSYDQVLFSIGWHSTPHHVQDFIDYLKYLGIGEGAQVHGIGVYVFVGDDEKRRLENWKYYGERLKNKRNDMFNVKYEVEENLKKLFLEKNIEVNATSIYADDLIFDIPGDYHKDEVKWEEADLRRIEVTGLKPFYYLVVPMRFEQTKVFYVKEDDLVFNNDHIEILDKKQIYGKRTNPYAGFEMKLISNSINLDHGWRNLTKNTFIRSIAQCYYDKMNGDFTNEEGRDLTDFFEKLGINESELYDKGQQYKLNIPDVDNEMLQEDDLMSEQPENILQSIKDFLPSLKEENTGNRYFDKTAIRYYNKLVTNLEENFNNMNARNFYKKLGYLLYLKKHLPEHGQDDPFGGTVDIFDVENSFILHEGTVLATQALREAGVKGIHYNGNRDGDCAVIFDGSDIEILETYFPPKKGIDPETGESFRYSIAQQPTTPEQGTAIPNAPGMYKMRNGTIQAHPEYIPPGLETETAIYAAIAISDIAKNEPGLEDVRAMINADEMLREEVLAELSQRGIEDTRDNEFLYAIRNVLQTREPEDPTYQAIVDVFHEAITKATGGIQDDILLTDSDIAAAAHAITNTPFEPLIGEPVPTVPTPKPTVFDQMEANWAMMQSTIDEAVANAEVSERETPIIRYSIAGVDMRLDGVEGYNGVDGRQKLYAELEQIYGSTHQWNEWDSFYNQLAAAQITGTQEVRDVGALAAPADSNRGLVDQFLNAALPDYLKDKIQIEWTMTPDAVKNLNGGLASFDPRGGAADKLIYIQGWGRTVGQVIRSAAWELSRFGWNAAPGAMTNLKKPLVELYNLHESAIYQELSPYYTKYKINRANVSDKHKIFLVQTYFAKMNQDILTGNPNALAQQIGIDPTTYKRIHDEIVQNVNTATTDLTNYIENYAAISTDPEIAKAFTQDILRLIMGGMHGRGAAFVYETANSAGPSDTIYCYTNDFGLHRKFVAPTDEDNRYARIANEIKQNLKWWRETFEPWGLGDLAEKFCRFFLRNFPMHNGLSFLHLNVPSAHLGDTTITKATSLISRIWQRVDDPHGIEVRNNLKVMERIHAILRDHNYDARWTENATNGYEALFRSLGITDEKSIATAQLADRALPDMLAMIQHNAVEIRKEFSKTIDSLVTHMETSGNISEREIANMTQKMNNYAESFLGDYEHRTYEAYSLDGLDELIAMHHDLNVDPNTGELTIHAKAAAAQKFIADTEQRLGGRNAEFYKQTEEARNIVRRASRLDSLRKYKQAKVLISNPSLRGGELDEKVIREMNEELEQLINDVQEMKTADRGIYKRFNYIPGAKRRKLDERIEIDREYMNFLGRVTDPLMNALYSIDQQKKVIEKLYFNRELGEHIISSGMGSIRGDAVASSVGEGTIQEISTLEGGTFLEYVRVHRDFQKEINAEYSINSKVRDSVLGGVIDVWKANNTIYSLRLGINNYVGNFSMLLASGHLWRFANIFQAGQITKRQFLERFTTNVNGLDATAQELYEEMRQARVVGGTMSEMNVMAYGRGVHEKVIGFFLKHLRDANALSSEGKFVAETWVNSFLEKMKTFYAFGDEWVKPLMYLNNRANAIAKWESKLDPNAPEFGGNIDEWRREVRKRAIEEAAEQTVRESVSWENSPQFVRWLSQKNLRIFTPDFLMHNFQMLRITASNFLRLGECFRELNNLEVNNERDANYKDALVKEIAQRGVGGAMTTAVYAGLMGATGSVMALVPYMVNVLFNNIEGDGGDDDKKGMFFGPDEWEGAQRLMNYKTGGNNLFVPVFKAGDKIYAWNYVRSSVMLTHAPVRPPTDDPTFVDYGAVIMRNVVDLQNGTMTQQLINNMMGKDRFGREIGVVEGWARVLERTLVPGFARQLAGVTLGYPPSDNMFHEGRLIKVPDLLGITVNAYDPRDVANHLAYDINSHNTDRNIHRRNFVEQLSKSDRLSDKQIVGMITDMRERNAKDLAKANYVVTGLRQVGMTDQEIVHWLTHNRKTGGDALPRKHAVGLLKGKDIYDEALITTLVNKRNQLNEGPQNLRMSKEELAVVSANLDKAIRMYKQALRAQ